MKKGMVKVTVAVKAELLEELFKLCRGDFQKVQEQLSNDLDFIYRYLREDREEIPKGEKNVPDSFK